MPQQNFTTASAPVMMLYIGGAIAQFLSAMPDATAFRYTAVRFTTFGQAWYFENFSKGATSYLGESLTYEATRNKDIHEATYVRYELPGIGNVQTYGDLQPSQTSVTAPHTGAALPQGTSTPAAQIYEVLHDDICPRYQEAVSTQSTYTQYKVTGLQAVAVTDDYAIGDMISLLNTYRVETNSSCVSESYFTTSDTTNFKRKGEGQPYYTDGVAIAAIKSVDFEIGGQRMDRHDKYAIYTWLMLNSGSIGVPLDMCGLATTTAQKNLELKRASMAFQIKYCPLIFSFCRAPSMGVPLISNMYNNLTLRVEFEPFSALICNYSGAGLNGAQGTTAVKPTGDLEPDGRINGTHDGRAYPSAPARNFGGASIGIVPATTQFYTRVRKNEDTLANSYARTTDLQPGNNFTGITAATSATVTSSNLTQEHYGVSIVSKAYFLGPEERTAFASNAFNQIVECCQRIMLSTTQTASQAYRIDQFQNAASSMYVCPIYKPNLANNQYFTHGGAYDHVRDQTWPAVNTVELSTNGAVLYQAADESFYRQVQPFAHHSNVLPPWRRVYALNFGIRANAMFKPVQANGYLNWSRTANAMLTLTHPDNLWATASNTALHVTPTASTLLQILVVVWNYNVLQYRGGIAGFKYTQGNNSA